MARRFPHPFERPGLWTNAICHGSDNKDALALWPCRCTAQGAPRTALDALIGTLAPQNAQNNAQSRSGPGQGRVRAGSGQRYERLRRRAVSSRTALYGRTGRQPSDRTAVAGTRAVARRRRSWRKVGLCTGPTLGRSGQQGNHQEAAGRPRPGGGPATAKRA